jgi:hypothetical protein
MTWWLLSIPSILAQKDKCHFTVASGLAQTRGENAISGQKQKQRLCKLKEEMCQPRPGRFRKWIAHRLEHEPLSLEFMGSRRERKIGKRAAWVINTFKNAGCKYLRLLNCPIATNKRHYNLNFWWWVTGWGGGRHCNDIKHMWQPCELHCCIRESKNS